MATSFVPAAIADLTEAQAKALAHSPRHLAGWKHAERERCATDWQYFVEAYGSVEPAQGAVPFRLWPSQRDVATALHEHDRVIVLKNRQQGLSWLALHRALWLAAFAEGYDGARVAIYCKGREDASLQLKRIKRVIDRMPEWLRPKLAGDSKTQLDFEDRGGASIRILSGDPEALRGDTLTLLILDEFAYVRNMMAPDVWAAALPAVEHGQLICVSTGNGDTGDGGKYAELWRSAESGHSDLHPIFLGRDAHPGRDEAWFERESRRVGDPDRFNREYPAHPDDALTASSESTVFIGSHLGAAERLAALVDPAELGEACEVGIDWGNITASVYLRELPLVGGGIYVDSCFVQAMPEPSRATRAILERAPGERIERVSCDSQPPGTVRTAADVLLELHQASPERYPDAIESVVFSVFKEGGAGKKGVDTVGYIRYLLANTADTPEGEEPPGPRIAFSPEAKALVAQMRALQRVGGTGNDRDRIKKPPVDPRKPEQGDHITDALIAALASRALAHWHGSSEAESEENAPYEHPDWWK